MDRERKPLRIAGKAWRQQLDHRRRKEKRCRQQHDLACQQQSENPIGEKAGALGAPLLADARIGRDEGGVEGAFGENGAEVIGQAKRYEKCVGHRPGAEHRSENNVAGKPGDPRQQRQPTDRKNAFNH